MGFPVPGDAFEQSLDLNRYLVKNPAATFFMRVEGDLEVGQDVQTGDLLVVDRSRELQDNALVVAVIGGELVVLRVEQHQGQLIPAITDWSSDSDRPFEVWGVVTSIIRSV